MFGPVRIGDQAGSSTSGRARVGYAFGCRAGPDATAAAGALAIAVAVAVAVPGPA